MFKWESDSAVRMRKAVGETWLKGKSNILFTYAIAFTTEQLVRHMIHRLTSVTRWTFIKCIRKHNLNRVQTPLDVSTLCCVYIVWRFPFLSTSCQWATVLRTLFWTLSHVRHVLVRAFLSAWVAEPIRMQHKCWTFILLPIRYEWMKFHTTDMSKRVAWGRRAFDGECAVHMLFERCCARSRCLLHVESLIRSSVLASSFDSQNGKMLIYCVDSQRNSSVHQSHSYEGDRFTLYAYIAIGQIHMKYVIFR